MYIAIYLSMISLLAATGERLDDYSGDWTKMKAITPRGYVCYRATEPIRVDGEDLLARALQHEIDHLDGILFIDHVSGLKRQLLRGKLRKLQHRNMQMSK